MLTSHPFLTLDAAARCCTSFPPPAVLATAACRRWCCRSWSLSRRMTASASAASAWSVKAALYHCVAQSPEAKGATETVAVWVWVGVGVLWGVVREGWRPGHHNNLKQVRAIPIPIKPRNALRFNAGAASLRYWSIAEPSPEPVPPAREWCSTTPCRQSTRSISRRKASTAVWLVVGVSVLVLVGRSIDRCRRRSTDAPEWKSPSPFSSSRSEASKPMAQLLARPLLSEQKLSRRSTRPSAGLAL